MVHIEEFKPVKGWEGLYEVSNIGNVRSLDRYVNAKNDSLSFKRGRMLKLKVEKLGYLTVHLRDASTTRSKYKKIHRLVGLMFIQNPLNKNTINHIDGDKTNNHKDNLEWNTTTENNRHARETLLNIPATGERIAQSILIVDTVKLIRIMYKLGNSMPEISNILNIKYKHVWKIVRRKSWKHIGYI